MKLFPTSQQGDAPLRDGLQPEEAPEIRSKTLKKRSGNACFGSLCGKCLSMLPKFFYKASKIGVSLIS